MYQSLKLLIPVAGVALFQTVAMFGTPGAAQEADGCFMVNSSGEVVSLSTLCGGAVKKTSTNPKVFQAKIKRRQSGVPIIDVTFNGQQQFEMMLDTGASQTTITQKMAEALRIVPDSTEKSMIANGDVIESPVGRVDSISVGSAVVNKPAVSIGAVPLLGQNFFGEYDVIIRKDVVEFHAPGF